MTRCEDYREELARRQRRTCCCNCKMILCGWCYNHCHTTALAAGDDGCGIRPTFSARRIEAKQKGSHD